MEWDDEVDVVCVGSGAGALAAAIVAVDAGESVFVGHWPSRGRGPRDRLGVELADPETNEYLDALTQGMGSPANHPDDFDVPLRVVDDRASDWLSCRGQRRGVEPFVGARLRDWAARCASAKHGVLDSRVTNRHMTTMRSSAGEMFEAAVVGPLPDGVDIDGSLIADWLYADALRRGIDVHTASALDRLVFEGGRVVGAVVTTPRGSCAVRARGGVLVAAAGPGGNTGAPNEHRCETPPQVCIVSKTASRFGRIELLARAPVGSRLAAASPSPARQLPSQRLSSKAWCRSVPSGRPGGF